MQSKKLFIHASRSPDGIKTLSLDVAQSIRPSLASHGPDKAGSWPRVCVCVVVCGTWDPICQQLQWFASGKKLDNTRTSWPERSVFAQQSQQYHTLVQWMRRIVPVVWMGRKVLECGDLRIMRSLCKQFGWVSSSISSGSGISLVRGGQNDELRKRNVHCRRGIWRISHDMPKEWMAPKPTVPASGYLADAPSSASWTRCGSLKKLNRAQYLICNFRPSLFAGRTLFGWIFRVLANHRTISVKKKLLHTNQWAIVCWASLPWFARNSI